MLRDEQAPYRAHEGVAEALEDGVGGLQDAADNSEVPGLLLKFGGKLREQRMPLGREVMLADDGQRFAQLTLHSMRGADHQRGDETLDLVL
eukprot:scaffold648027_cov34-Prasinocladus_malaysianus.AAC.1